MIIAALGYRQIWELGTQNRAGTSTLAAVVMCGSFAIAGAATSLFTLLQRSKVSSQQTNQQTNQQTKQTNQATNQNPKPNEVKSRCLFLDKVPCIVHLDIELVVARYAEDLSWLQQKPFSCYRTTIYNKGPADISCVDPNRCKIVQLPNVGRNDHTFLWHIVQNHGALADVTVFLPASCTDSHKVDATRCMMGQVAYTGNTVLRGQMCTDLRKSMYDFKLDKYVATNPLNAKLNPENALQLSPIRPYGPWFDSNFSNLPPIHVFCYFSIFAVARAHIIQHDIPYYQKLLNQLAVGSNPEAGHYMERSWGAVFYPYPDACVFTPTDPFFNAA